MIIGDNKSKQMSMTCGVPQGSILALLLFSLYMFPLSQIMRNNQTAYNSYADDTQIYLALSSSVCVLEKFALILTHIMVCDSEL